MAYPVQRRRVWQDLKTAARGSRRLRQPLRRWRSLRRSSDCAASGALTGKQIAAEAGVAPATVRVGFCVDWA